MPFIVPGTGSEKLAERISKISGFPVARKSVRKFMDGETYVRLSEEHLEGDTYIIQSMFPEPNEKLIEMLLTADAVTENGGIPVAVMPYMAYSRQDRIFERGEAFSLKAVSRMLRSAGVRKVITVDAHFHRKEGSFRLFGLEFRNLTAVNLLAEHVRKIIKDVIFIGPDSGSRNFLAPLEGAVFMEKTKKFLPSPGRERKYKISIKSSEGISGRTVVLMDDIIASGGTIREAARLLKEADNNVSVACTHGLFIGDSLKKIGKYADYVISTDTVKSPRSVVSVAELIANEISE